MSAPRPTLTTFETFVSEMKKESEIAQKYFYKQIQFAEKEILRLREKGKRRYERKKSSSVPGESPVDPTV
jgi:hypothetical protein